MFSLKVMTHKVSGLTGRTESPESPFKCLDWIHNESVLFGSNWLWGEHLLKCLKEDSSLLSRGNNSIWMVSRHLPLLEISFFLIFHLLLRASHPLLHNSQPSSAAFQTVALFNNSHFIICMDKIYQNISYQTKNEKNGRKKFIRRRRRRGRTQAASWSFTLFNQTGQECVSRAGLYIDV